MWQGISEGFDAAEAAVAEADADLEAYLQSVRDQFGKISATRNIKFVSLNKESHLLEVR